RHDTKFTQDNASLPSLMRRSLGLSLSKRGGGPHENENYPVCNRDLAPGCVNDCDLGYWGKCPGSLCRQCQLATCGSMGSNHAPSGQLLDPHCFFQLAGCYDPFD